MFEDKTSAATAVLVARSPEELLDELLTEPPGPWLLGALDGLRDEVSTDAEHEKLLMCWDRFLPWAQAQRAHAMVGAAHEQAAVPGPFGPDDFGAEVVALLTGDTLATASAELETARLLETELHGCLSALERGEVSWRMANDVATATVALPAWQRELVDQRMVASWDIDRDITRWRRKLRREVLRVDDDAEVRRQRATGDRHVENWPLPDGMACVHAELRAQDAALVMSALTAVADSYADADRAAPPGGPEQLRSIDQRRADALVDLCANVLADPALPRRQGRRPTVAVTGGVLTLLGFRNDPGELAGYGPITAEHLREIAADGDWHRFLTAPDTGALISIGTATYRPKQALRDFMIAASPRCDFPGCSIPSSRTDAEHTRPHHRGGATDDANVRPRCRRHHRSKTHAGWSVTRLPDNSISWATPGGSRRLVGPHRLAGDESGKPDTPDDDVWTGRDTPGVRDDVRRLARAP